MLVHAAEFFREFNLPCYLCLQIVSIITHPGLEHIMILDFPTFCETIFSHAFVVDCIHFLSLFIDTAPVLFIFRFSFFLSKLGN